MEWQFNTKFIYWMPWFSKERDEEYGWYDCYGGWLFWQFRWRSTK